MIACRVEHVLREIDTDNSTARQGFEQLGRQAAGPAAGIEYEFVTAQIQPRQDLLSPTHLRGGKTMVDLRIPLTG